MYRIISITVVSGLLASVTAGFAAERWSSPRSARSYRAANSIHYAIAPRSPRGVRLSQNFIPPEPGGPVLGEGVPLGSDSLPPEPQSSASRVSAPTPIEPIPSTPGNAEPIGLYPHVKYEDLHNIHPCAVTKIVAVQDPCYDPRSCCAPSCVYVQICVPPCCEHAKVKVSRHGTKVEYDFGKYDVEIKSKRGVIKVDYDD